MGGGWEGQGKVMKEEKGRGARDGRRGVKKRRDNGRYLPMQGLHVTVALHVTM